MNLKEYKTVRKLDPDEINRAIKDFKLATPILNDGIKGEWNIDDSKNYKNVSFKEMYELVTGRKLTSKEVRVYIINELKFEDFKDLIYPQWCKTEEDCIRAIETKQLYWVFHVKNFSTYDLRGNDVNIGDLYVKLNTIDGNFYVVKSLHDLGYDKYGNLLNDEDIRFIHVYDEYMNRV